MAQSAKNVLRSRAQLAPALVLLLLLSGCVAGDPVANSNLLLSSGPAVVNAGADASPLRPAAVSSSSLPEGPLTVSQLVTSATERHPELAAAQAKAAAARGKLVQAGLYPNPLVSWEGDEIGNPEGGAGMQGVSFEQEIVTGGKLELAQTAAAQGVAAADWQAVTRRFELITRVRSAFYEVLAAQREARENEEIVAIAERGLKAAETLARTVGSQTDVLRARIELEQGKIRLATSRQRFQAAWRLLAVSIGDPDLKPRQLEGTLDAPVPAYVWESTLAVVLTRSSEVQEAQALVQQAESELGRAYADVCPNVHLKIHPFYSFPDKEMELLVGAGVAWPLFNRNQGNILAAQAEVARAVAGAREVELKLTERLTQSFQRYQTARQQVEAFTSKDGILDTAKESLRLITLAYEKGDPKFDINTFLDAQRTLVQARLAYIQAQGEVWRAAVEISGLLQEELK
jgi:outer membrane protein, heavy metal efflux system